MQSAVYGQLYNILDGEKLSDVLDEIAAVCFDMGEEAPHLGWREAGELIEKLADDKTISEAGQPQ